jgi:NAD(P)-dependent dehydrogenase (short-subunit alcohol dehydrogenase family)
MNNNIDSIFSLSGKIIVITGAAGLLGEMHAEAVAAYGGTPVLLDLSQTAVDVLAEKLNKKYKTNAIGFAIDITNERKVEIVSNKVFKRFGKIDGLVNNAANNPKVETTSEKNFSRLENFPLNIWEQDIAVGLTGSYLCIKYFGFQISQNKDGGSIVNISSDLGVMAPDQRLYEEEGVPKDQQNVKPVTYSVVKSGLIGLTRYIATYWSDKNVRCNAMCPGGVENGQPRDFLNKVHARIPMNRLAKSDEYQGTLLWMLSDASSYLNGAIISVDGGRTAW